ncbi:MAG: AraC family transcriptional regulator [Clostridiales bacterium]|nr:AraC family transcriptional regulator [Clostridiales bacterium]
MGRIYYQRETPDQKLNGNCPETFFAEKPRYFSDIIFHSRSDTSDFYVVTAGHDKSWPDKIIQDRVTDRLMILFVVDGQGYIDDRIVGAGQGIFLYPNEKHSITQEKSNPMELYFLTFRGSKMAEFIINAGLQNIPRVFEYNWQDKIIPIFEDMIYRSHEGADMEMYLYGASQMIMSYHKHHYNKEKRDPSLNSKARYVKEAVNYIRHNFTRDISVAEIANQLHLTPNYLGNIFREELGYSPMSLIISLRMAHALNLLVENQFTVKQIAWMVGYKDYSQFSKMFKKHYGISPTAYAERLLQK